MASDPRSLDATSLREHTNALRVLARSLVHDEHVAEDVAQDALVTAMGTAPKRGWGLGNWLRGITRNHARDAVRSSRRRREREETAARPESCVDESLERVELLQDMLRHVRELEEPFRSTVLQHYFDGLSQREIAARHGVAYATVRTRLHRALEQLRARMDRDAGGDRRAWIAGLLPFVQAPVPGPFADIGDGVAEAASRLGSLGAQAAGTLAMKKQALGIAALAVATLTAGYWTLKTGLSGGPESPETSAAPLPGAIEEAPEAPSKDLGAELRRVDRDDAKPAPSQDLATGLFVTILGRVRSADGRAIRGAVVQVKEKSTRSAADGRYELRVPLYAGDKLGAFAAAATKKTWTKGYTLELRALAAGHAVEHKKVEVRPDTRELRADFALDLGFAIFGRVVDPSGRPIGGATVATWNDDMPPATSDEDGRYRLEHLPRTEREHWIRARAKGFAAAWEHVVLEGGTDASDARQDFRLKRGAGLRGVVFDSEKRRLPGALIRILDKPALEVISDERGEFEVTGIRAGRVRLQAFAKGYPIHAEELDFVLGQTREVQVEMRTGVPLSGEVVDREGRALDGAFVQVRTKTLLAGKTKTDEQGAFDLAALPPEGLSLTVSKPGYVGRELTDLRAPTRGLRIVLEASARFAGKVVDAATGQAITKFRVRLVREGADAQNTKGARGEKLGKKRGKGLAFAAKEARDFFGRGRSFENEAGHWNSDGLPLNEGFVAGVEISADGFAPLLRASVRARVGMRADELRHALIVETLVRGRVVAEASGRGIAGARIRVLAPDLGAGVSPEKKRGRRRALAQAKSTPDGSFELTGLGAGLHRAIVEHRDFGLSIHELRVPPGARAWTTTIRVGAGSTLRGVVRDGAGRALAKVRVTLRALRVAGVAGKRWTTESDDTGAFEFRHLPRGEYVLARLTDFGRGAKTLPTLPRRVQISRPSHDVELSPRGLASVNGQLSCARGAVPQGACIRLVPLDEQGEDDSSRGTARWVYARNARFRIEGLEAGRYRASCTHRDAASGAQWRGSVDFVIRSNAEERLVLTLR